MVRRFCIIIFLFVFASSVLHSADLPSGHVVRVISQLGDGWATDLKWLPGDSSAAWIEHPPNVSYLAKLVYWDGETRRVLHAAGANSFACGVVDSQTVIILSAAEPDTGNWDKYRVHVCIPPIPCRKLALPAGNMKGLLRWDGASDTLFYALCVDPFDEPARFNITLDGELRITEKPLPVGFEFPIGSPPDDSTAPCFSALFIKQPAISSQREEPLSGHTPDNGLYYESWENRIVFYSETDSLPITFYNVGEILEIVWAKDSNRALVSLLGNPSRVVFLTLVR